MRMELKFIQPTKERLSARARIKFPHLSKFYFFALPLEVASACMAQKGEKEKAAFIIYTSKSEAYMRCHHALEMITRRYVLPVAELLEDLDELCIERCSFSANNLVLVPTRTWRDNLIFHWMFKHRQSTQINFISTY